MKHFQMPYQTKERREMNEDMPNLYANVNTPVIFIPARLGSSRLPNKPLLNLGEKTILQLCYESAEKTGFPVCVVTSDTAVADHINSFGGMFIQLGEEDIQNGTERIAVALDYIHKTVVNEKTEEKVREMLLPFFKADLIINVQGDLINFSAQMIHDAISHFLVDSSSYDIFTLCTPVSDYYQVQNHDVPKVILDKFGFAIYFSRYAIPWGANAVNKHIGIYFYTASFLSEFKKNNFYRDIPTKLDEAESLEQLRFLYYGHRIKVFSTSFNTVEINNPYDMETARRELKTAFIKKQ